MAEAHGRGVRSLGDIRAALAWLDPHLSGVRLNQITGEMCRQIQQARVADGVAPASVNRTMEVLRAVLNAAKGWGWIDSAPVVLMLAEPRRRVRWLTREEADRVIRELPPHLAAMARFTLATGLRESNVTGLRWSQIDMGRRTAWIHGDEIKTGKALAVPLNDEAVAVLREQVGQHQEFVFIYNGHPVTKANNHAWRKALRRARITDFRWHDLRHTWASWHVQQGTPLHVLMELGGWSDYSMVLRYAHLGGQHLQEWAAQVSKPNWQPKGKTNASK
jgi:integrase